jgi:hypothetical protein
MTRDFFADASAIDRGFDSCLHGIFVDVMATELFSDMERASDSAHFIDQLRLHDCDKRIWFRVDRSHV